ncbi:MAG: carbon storage regulator [Eubacteriales bacterium]|nr:carbon storage regulator [Eubacteriales bacterium]
MLVLSRKSGEGITLDQDVIIDILSIDGDRVRIGIQAPKDMRIFRKELLKETIGINQAAANTPAVSLLKQKAVKKKAD